MRTFCLSVSALILARAVGLFVIIIILSCQPIQCLNRFKKVLNLIGGQRGIADAFGNILSNSFAGMAGLNNPYGQPMSSYPYGTTPAQGANGYAAPIYPNTTPYSAFSPTSTLDAQYNPYQQLSQYPVTTATPMPTYNQFGSPPMEASGKDSYSEYIEQYGVAPALPSTEAHNATQPTAEIAAVEEKQNASELASAPNPDDSSIPSEMIFELKKLIASQQNDVTQLQKQVNELLEELKEEQRRVSDEKARAATQGLQHTLHMDIDFPSKEESSSENEATSSSNLNNSTEKSSESNGEAASEEAEFEATEPIPLMVLKPDAIGDIASLLKQSKQQQEAEIATEEREATNPPEIQLLTPEERLNEALAKTDELEAKKGEIETEMRIAEKRLKGSDELARHNPAYPFTRNIVPFTAVPSPWNTAGALPQYQ